VPCPLATARETIKDFIASCHDVATVIFASLSASLDLPPGAGIDKYHRFSDPSPDILRLLKYRAIDAEDTYRVPQTPHTDLGSLTLLFTCTPGLQVLSRSAGNDKWKFVEPKEGHVVVNIGDALTLMTNGVLKSSLHRVGPPPGQAMLERYSFAYLMRPADHTVLKPMESAAIAARGDSKAEHVTFKEWMARKFNVIRGTPSSGKDDWMLTSSTEIKV
jgi:isopenicillin N synthase-like dioxygenase